MLFLQAMRPAESGHSFLPPADIGSLLNYLAAAIVLVGTVRVLAMIVRPKQALKNWHHHFEDLPISAESFFSSIKEEVEKRHLPDIKISYMKFFESGIFSARRIYLRIETKKFNMSVGCMPFGHGSYVSWWLAEADISVFANVPVINDLLGVNPKFKSYYQLDTATLFQSGVHDAILGVIDAISKSKGAKSLTEREREPRYGRM